MDIDSHTRPVTWTRPPSAIADGDERLRLLVDAVEEYAIFLLAPDGTVMTWNAGAERLKGYSGNEIIGHDFSAFYPPEDVAAGKPQRELEAAIRDGVLVDDGWRVRKDGTRFWAHVVITALFDGAVLRGFAKVTRDDTAARAAMGRGLAVQDITRALLIGADTSDVLAKVAQHARNLTGADRTWLAAPSDSALVVIAADGQVAGPDVAASMTASDPIHADVMATGQPRFIDDMSTSCPEIPGLEALGAGLLVPLVTSAGANGVLVAASVAGTAPFGPVDLELLQVFAQQAELVLAYGESQRALRNREVIDDRERIARDLHDHVIQQLFAAGLTLESTAMRSLEPDVRNRLADTVDRLDTTIRQIRTTIFELQSGSGKPPDSTRSEIRTLVHEVSRAVAFVPQLQLEGPIDSVIGASAREHLLAALREMLSNVARHAGATAASVSVCVTDEIVARVVDNGVGPPKELVAGSGLGNLSGRAGALGGSFRLEACVGPGAIATWRIPATAT